MVDENVLNLIVAEGKVGGKTVLEVGPGLGFLTERLAGTAKKVIAIEKDKKFRKVLTKLPPNVEVIYGDVLKEEWPRFDVCISNLPYQISSPFTFRLLENKFERAVLTYQYEFGRRMVAAPGSRDWCRLSATLSFLADVKLLKKISRNCFWPPPEIDSAVVSLAPRDRPENWGGIKKVIDKMFNQPRKRLRNSLKIGSLPPHLAEKRPGTITPQEIEELTTLM